MEEIGATKIRQDLELYIGSVFRGPVPDELSARQRAMDAAGASDSDEMVGDLSEGFTLLAAWARTHRDQFRAPGGR